MLSGAYHSQRSNQEPVRAGCESTHTYWVRCFSLLPSLSPPHKGKDQNQCSQSLVLQPAAVAPHVRNANSQVPLQIYSIRTPGVGRPSICAVQFPPDLGEPLIQTNTHHTRLEANLSVVSAFPDGFCWGGYLVTKISFWLQTTLCPKTKTLGF